METQTHRCESCERYCLKSNPAVPIGLGHFEWYCAAGLEHPLAWIDNDCASWAYYEPN